MWMRTIPFITVFMALLAAGPVYAAVEFDFDTGLNGWTAPGPANGMTNPVASQSVLGFDYVTPTGPFDPMIISPAISASAAVNHWLVIQINITAQPTSGPISFQIFYTTVGGGGFNEPQSRVFLVTPNLGWQTLVFDMLPVQSGKDPWSGTVTQIRIDPGSDGAPLVGYHCGFDRIILTNDTDGDGISDDDELRWFGDLTSADATTDHDKNGITDAVEITLGLNPLIDQGERLPAADACMLAALFCAIAVIAARKIATAR